MANLDLSWGNEEHTAILITLHPGWSWKDFYDITPQVVAMMKTTDQPVYVISDQTLASATPIGVFMHARNFWLRFPPILN